MICSAVMPLIRAALTLSLLRLATARLPNLYNISQNRANRAICRGESEMTIVKFLKHTVIDLFRHL